MFKRAAMVALLAASGVVAGISLHTAATQGDTVFSGQRPANLGVREGRLAMCKRTPNCVSSQAPKDDVEHYIAPLGFRGNGAEALALLREVTDTMDRTLVVAHEGEYLRAEFRSRRLGFVDDVEFHVAAEDGAIHVRSASRMGRRDFGVNRARVEAIRRAFQAAQGSAVQG